LTLGEPAADAGRHWNRADGEVTITLEASRFIASPTSSTEDHGREGWPSFTSPRWPSSARSPSHRPAGSATVTLAAGARYVTWDMVRLRRVLIRSPALRIGLGAAFNRDMAEKVARA
jgi:hypothetical protein